MSREQPATTSARRRRHSGDSLKTSPISTSPCFRKFWNSAMAESYDIVVVGAGPAGSNAARTAAKRGAKFFLIDRKQPIGLPVQCAELVSQWISRHASFTPKSIIQSTGEMIVHFPDRTT